MIRLPFAHLLRRLLRHQQGMENSKEPRLEISEKVGGMRSSWYVKTILVGGLYIYSPFPRVHFQIPAVSFRGSTQSDVLTSHPCEYMMGCLEDKPFPNLEFG